MKKIRIFLLIAVLGLILPLSVNAASRKNVYIFKGATCSHCKEALKFFQDLADDSNYTNKFDLIEYEVWNNDENARLGTDVAKELGKEKLDGVPFIVIGDQFYSGFGTSTGEQIKTAIDNYYNDDSITNVVEKVRDNGEYNVEPEYTLKRKSNVDTIIAIAIIFIAVCGFGYVIYLSRKDNVSKYYVQPAKKEKIENKKDNIEKEEREEKEQPKITNENKNSNSKKTTNKKKNKKRK